ncbi:MAG TPA: glycosyltransferase family 9 protein [Ignavibacteriaceae bacterium]|nr:MAG: ADP-heptose--LPS heptosyltransferase 2 [Ignavibacteria bacterium ADurb.Bin266]HQI39912.1 glycosyltransferase family 9 protein [Ignavibacteriaceae bacterium]
MTPIKLSELHRILVIRLSSLGDILLTTPLIRTIKNQFPVIKIDFLVRTEYADALKLNPHLNKLYLFSKEDDKNSSLLSELKQNNYDLIIDLQNNLRSRKVTNHLSTRVLRFDKKSFDKFLLVQFKINRLKSSPQIPVRYASVIPDLILDENGLELITDKEPDSRIDDKKINIGLCPGARHFTKRWPAEYYIELGNKLSENNFRILLFGGKSDRLLCKKINEAIPGSIDLSNNDELLQTAADMKLCSLVVCNDSGLMHVATTTSAKVITIFGSSVREFGFTPYRSNNIILENKSLNCRPCSHIGKDHCPKKHFKCMLEIKPDLVFKTAIEFLEK